MTLLERIEKWRGYKSYSVLVTFYWLDDPQWAKINYLIRATSKVSAVNYAIRLAVEDVQSGWVSVKAEVSR